jgi:hypothetical protein
MRYRDDIIDMLTMHPETRRNVVRPLGEIDPHKIAGSAWVSG